MTPSGRPSLRDRLSPAMRTEMERWRDDHPLAALRTVLASHADERTFLDAFAEAVVGRRLLERGAAIRREEPTPGGRACDFRVDLDGERFYLHVKRFDSGRPARRLSISGRLRALERIERPYVVRVRWREHADDRAMQRLVQSAEEFIRHARVGDELVVHDERDGSEIGGVLVVAPWDGPHVSLAIGLPDGFIDESRRLRRLLDRAARQFMPRARNAIVVASTHLSDAEDLDAALLGAHVERWDAYPPRGRRIAHGRAEDGFWADARFPESRVVAWFRLEPSGDLGDLRLWTRTDAPADRAFEASVRRALADA